MIVQAHGVGNDFKAVLQGTVVLAVGAFPVPVGDFQDSAGAVGILAALVDLQLHAKVTGAFAMENGRGLVVIVLDGVIAAGAVDFTEAVGAVGDVRIIVFVMSFIHVQDRSTAVTTDIVAFIAAFAEGQAAVASTVLPPDAVAAMRADDRLLVEASGAEVLTVELDALGEGILLTTDFAGKGFRFHRFILPIVVFPRSLRGISGG